MTDALHLSSALSSISWSSVLGHRVCRGGCAGEVRGMEAYQQSQDRHEALREHGMPAIALPHTPPPLCTGLLAGNDSEHGGQLFTPGAPTQVIIIIIIITVTRFSSHSRLGAFQQHFNRRLPTQVMHLVIHPANKLQGLHLPVLRPFGVKCKWIKAAAFQSQLSPQSSRLGRGKGQEFCILESSFLQWCESWCLCHWTSSHLQCRIV